MNDAKTLGGMGILRGWGAYKGQILKLLIMFKMSDEEISTSRIAEALEISGEHIRFIIYEQLCYVEIFRKVRIKMLEYQPEITLSGHLQVDSVAFSRT